MMIFATAPNDKDTVIIHALIANYNHRLKKLVFRTFISKICLVCFCLLTSY